MLEQTGWNVTRAAAILGIDRVTVYNKVRKYGLQREGGPGLEAAPDEGAVVPSRDERKGR